ncbi:PREDICTED: AT-hook motif nuclear-localized protein 7-like [Lupinus angustifolius]|uniref:AT-hook motif nuclear-localized protein 7-like n=1 Tax=Lupinus angustifolius TaxID=3871 RepID=UPI00092F7573|nr:PREDICTED: AT-hook motif nuclear-localized protein 7-like [Lupinus angustifolius]
MENLCAEPGSSMATHVMIVNVGECISTEILALSRDLGRNICVLTANGEISRVKLRLPSNEHVTYEGGFVIQSLGGSLVLFDGGSGPSGRSGGLTVSFFGPSGHLVGGAVAGEMIAASTVQVVLLSFPGEFGNASKEPNKTGNSSAPAPPKVDVVDGE